MNNEWAFLAMRSSNELLGDPDALRARMDEDGYLLLRDVIDRERILDVRRQVLVTLAEQGWVEGGWHLMKGLAVSEPRYEGLADFASGYDAVQRLEAFHTLAHDPAPVDVMRQVVGPTAWPHPLKIARLAFPANYEITTPPHQDYPNNQGTSALCASWIPLGTAPAELGGLAILRGSHRFGVLELAGHPGAGNRQAVIPTEMAEQLRWVTTDYRAGDVLLFPSLTVHASLHNASELHLRCSVDFRWQQEGEDLTEVVLHPHFQRLTWEDIYRDWSSTQHQYYWRDLDYRVVPFVDLLARAFDTDPDTDMHEAVLERIRDGSLTLSAEEWEEMVHIDAKQRTRLERRRALLREVLGDDVAETAADTT